MIAIIIIIVVYPLAFLSYYVYGDKIGLYSNLGKVPIFNQKSQYDVQEYINYDTHGGEVRSAYNSTHDNSETLTLYQSYFSNNGWFLVFSNESENGAKYTYQKNFANNRTYALELALYSDSPKTEVTIKSNR